VMSQRQIVSQKRERSLRIGTGRVKAPGDVHSYVTAFATARSYQRAEDAIFYILRWASAYLPPMEKFDGQSGDNESKEVTT
jgi:hypothetical protein